MRKAYELNTYDLSMAASYGYALVFSGDYREGASILQRAVDASSAHPTWWDYGLFLAEFMLDDMDKASRASRCAADAQEIALSRGPPRRRAVAAATGSASVRLPPNWSAPIRGLLPIRARRSRAASYPAAI